MLLCPASVLTLATMCRATAGPSKKKVRWSDEQEEQQKQDGTMKAAGSSTEGSSTRRGRKAAAPAGKGTQGGGKAKAAPAASLSKENVVLPFKAPGALPAGQMAAATKKQGTPGSGAASAAASKPGGQGKAGKGRVKTPLRRMQKSLSKTG